MTRSTMSVIIVRRLVIRLVNVPRECRLSQKMCLNVDFVAMCTRLRMTATIRLDLIPIYIINHYKFTYLFSIVLILCLLLIDYL